MPRSLAVPQSSAFQATAATLPALFECSQINGDPDAVCVHACGDLDIATAPQLELTLREALSRAGLVVLDLGDLAFIDSAGVHAIVDASIHARQIHSRLVVLPGPASVERIFALAGAQGNLAFAFGMAEAPASTNAYAKAHKREQAQRRFPRIAQKTLSAAANNPAIPLRARAAPAAVTSQGARQRTKARPPTTADGGELRVRQTPSASPSDGMQCRH